MNQAPDIYVASGGDDLFETAARRFVAASGEVLAKSPACRIALSGGSTPARLYRLLSGPLFRDRVDWSRVHFFWGDERCVPPDDPRSNYLMAKETLLSHLDLSPAQVHRIVTERLEPWQAAAAYEETLSDHFGLPAGGPPPCFDVILLGLGPDGHTASLFPYTRALREKTRWTAAVERPGDVARITLTFPVLNAALNVHVLALGEEKAPALHSVLEGSDDPEKWPARRLKPSEGRLAWFLDRPAASLLRGGMETP